MRWGEELWWSSADNRGITPRRTSRLNRAPHQLYRVVDRQRAPQLTQVAVKLCGAAGVARGDRIGPGVAQVSGLARAELGRGVGLEHVVDAGRSAADLAFGADLQQLQLRNHPQQLPGLLAHALCVRKV